MEQEDTELITALKQEVEELKAQRVLDEVKFEHELHTSETKLNVYYQQLQLARERIEKVEKAAVDASADSLTLKSQLEKNSENILQYEAEIKRLKAEIATIDCQKRDGLAALDARTLEITQNSAEYQELQEKLSAAKKQVNRLESELQVARHTELSSKFKQQTVEQELHLLREQNEWLTQELNTKTDEFGRYRREKTMQLSRLQSDLDAATDSEAAAILKANAASRRYEEQASKLDDALTNIKELQNQLVSEEENFKNEMAAQIRLAALWENSSNEAKERMADLDEVIIDLQHSLEEKKEELEHATTRYTEETDSLKAELMSAEAQLEKLQVELHRANEILGTTVDAGDADQSRIRAGLLSPTAAITSHLRKSGKPFTEIYSEYITLQEQLANEKRENSQLQEFVQQILQDINERTPILQEQHREFIRISSEATERSNQLDALIAERDELSSKLEDAKLAAERFERENVALQVENHDLGRQVQALLREIERQKGMSDGFFEGGVSSLNIHSDLLDTSTVISEQLTTFRSISELQQQNQRLLRITRELADRMEREEAERRETDAHQENETVQEAQKLIEILRDELKQTRAKMESYLRERDMCRRLLAQGDPGFTPTLESPSPLRNFDAIDADQNGGEYSKLLVKLQSKFDSYRKETDAETKTLRDQLTSAQKEISEYHIQAARASAQIDFLNERYQLLVENAKSHSNELEEARKRISNLQGALSRQDVAAQQSAQDLVEAKEALERIRIECSNLRAEKEVSKSLEVRLVQENETLSKERAHLNGLMNNLQNMQNELEKVQAAAKRRYENQVHSLEEELKHAKQRLSDEIDANKALSLRKENESKDYQVRLDKAISDHQQTREALIVAETSMRHLNDRISELNKQLREAENMVTLYQQKEEREPISTGERLRQEIARLKTELATATAESAQLRQQAEQYKLMSQSNEDALSEINQTYDEYKTTTDKIIEVNEMELADLKETIESLNNKLRDSVAKIAQDQEKMGAERTNWETEKKNYESQISRLAEIEEKAKRDQESFQVDLRQQAKMAEEAQDNYERELLMHASDIQIHSKLKEQYQKLSGEVQLYQIQTETAEAKLKTSEASWRGQKELLEKSILELEKRCQDLVAQNNLLHAQFETVSAQALRIQKADSESAVVPEGETRPASDKSLEEVHEVLRFVRREKEILQGQHELALQESRRLKQQLDYANQSLDETRALLAEERQREQKAIQSAMQHAEILEKINQLNILRESNVTLREENEKNIAKLQSLEKSLEETSGRIDPLEEQIRNYQADIEAKNTEIKALEEDNQRWKMRTRQILQKHERIDPVEHQALKDESERLRLEYTSLAEEKNLLATELQELKEQSSTSVDNLNKRITKLTEHCSLWKKRYEHVSAQTKEKLQQQAGQLAELAAAQKSVEELKDIKQQLEKIQAEKQKLQEERDSLTSQISSSAESEKAKFENMRKTALGYYHKLKQIEGEFKKVSEEKRSLEQAKSEAIETAIKEKTKELETEHTKALKETEMRSKIKLSLAEGQVKKLQAKLKGGLTTNSNSISAPSTPIQSVETPALSELTQSIDQVKSGETPSAESELQPLAAEKSIVGVRVEESVEAEQQVSPESAPAASTAPPTRQALLKAKLQKQKLQRMKQQKQQKQQQKRLALQTKAAVGEQSPAKRAKSSSPQLQKLKSETPILPGNSKPNTPGKGKGRGRASPAPTKPTTPIPPSACDPGAVPVVSVSTAESTDAGEATQTSTNDFEEPTLEHTSVETPETKAALTPTIRMEAPGLDVSNELGTDSPINQEMSESEATTFTEEMVSQDESYPLEDSDPTKPDSISPSEAIDEKVTSEPEIVESVQEIIGETQIADTAGNGLKRVRDNNEDASVNQSEADSKKVRT
ncbi:hypothetical protein K493DRAFT_361138 [Basidiobolus meristosporus CBS 931.73]|uniref:Uncharacterized protein n=1 Tax=Basidiobolus meristosporus CBS 931.73 TaxID=1314790 RepID=A0A1Y1XD02_9FUNG|nr:hypothetical protein K493DRAFT_361138 [Basidiobolus meristosporus CBS 931.73]|eukprot:ORX83254.1 hypothetical protein K493DRAFT_361138 [Basidiobolus meristosporus CBS 931.73]